MISSFSGSQPYPWWTSRPYTRPVGHSLIDSYGRYVYVDQLYAALWHSADPASLEGDSIFQYYCDSTAILDLISHADRYGFSSTRVQAYRVDGSSFSVALRIETLTLAQTKHYLCSVFDLASNETASLLDQPQALSYLASQASTCALFQLVPHAVYALELDAVSPQVTELCGVSLLELQEGANLLLQRVDPHDRKLLLRRLTNYQQRREPVRFQFRYQHPSKGQIWIETFLWPQDPNSADSNLFCFAQDITHQIPISIRQHFSALTDEADMLVTLDPDLRIAEMNSAARQVFQIFGDNLIGRDFAAIFPYIDQDYSLGQLRQILQEEGFWKTRFAYVPQRRSELVLLMRRSHRSGANTNSLASASQVLFSSHATGLAHFVGGLAHNVNNLLMIIMGYSELIQAQVSPNGVLYKDLQHIYMAGDQLRMLVNQLLAYGGIQDLSPSSGDLGQLLRALERDLWRELPSDITLQFELEPQLPLAYIDQAKLGNVIVELIKNACYAMNNTGTIVLSLRRVSSQDLVLYDLPAQIDESFIMLRISDTGSGMDLETQRQAFEPFFTTKELGEGMGLGLAMVYGIIDQSGGAIVLESGLNQGTSVVIFLPSVNT